MFSETLTKNYLPPPEAISSADGAPLLFEEPTSDPADLCNKNPFIQCAEGTNYFYVNVDPNAPDEEWQRFCRAIGISKDNCQPPLNSFRYEDAGNPASFNYMFPIQDGYFNGKDVQEIINTLNNEATEIEVTSTQPVATVTELSSILPDINLQTNSNLTPPAVETSNDSRDFGGLYLTAIVALGVGIYTLINHFQHQAKLRREEREYQASHSEDNIKYQKEFEQALEAAKQNGPVWKIGGDKGIIVGSNTDRGSITSQMWDLYDKLVVNHDPISVNLLYAADDLNMRGNYREAAKVRSQYYKTHSRNWYFPPSYYSDDREPPTTYDDECVDWGES